MIIALDGPAGSGKTSTAKAVAQALGFVYLDTGAMYRAMTLAALEAGVDMDGPSAESDVTTASLAADFGIAYIAGNMHVYLDGTDVTPRLRSIEVNDRVSQVSAYRAVREAMVDVQRKLATRVVADGGGVVIDGRDIGTVVFPDADVKVFMDASPEVRARRRFEEMKGAESGISLDSVLSNVKARDAYDSTREHAPLRKAEDAMLLDTSLLSFEEQVSSVVNKVLERQV